MDNDKTLSLRSFDEAKTLIEIEGNRAGQLWNKGEIIDNLYRVENIIKGGMGIIYFIDHLKWGIKLVVKSPAAHMSDKKNLFIKEAETWVDLGKHPNIATAFYVKEIQGLPRIFIEYADGGALTDWIKEDRNFPQILDRAIQFCEGMKYAHKKGLVHRDVKPDNVLLMKDGTVKITDFGLVKTKDKLYTAEMIKNLQKPPSIPQQEWHTMTEGHAMGTPPYMAPEQWTQADKADRRADIYSFGVMLFEMLCRRRPFIREEGNPHPPALAYQIFHRFTPPPDPCEYRKDIPEKLKNLILKCLEKEAVKRYDSFDEIISELILIYREVTGREYDRKMPGEAELKAEDLNNRALSYLDIGKKEDAKKFFEEAIKLDPLSIYANINLLLLMAEEKWESHENISVKFRSVREGNPENPIPYYYEAIFELEYGNPMNSLSLIKEAIDMDKKNTLFWNLKGVILFTLERYTESLEDFKRAINIDKENTEAVINEGKVNYYLKNYSKSCESLRKALNLYQGNNDIKTDLSIALTGEEKFTEALSLLDEVLKKDDTSITANLYKGEILSGITKWVPTFNFTECDKKAALPYLQKSAELAPNLPRARESCSECSKDTSLPLQTVLQADIINEKEIDLLTPVCGDIKVMGGMGGKIRKVSFLKDKKIISINTDSMIEIWDRLDGKCIKKFSEDSSYMKFEGFDIALSPCGKFIFSAHGDSTVKMWDISEGELIRTFYGTSIVRTVDCSSDGKTILSAGAEGIINLWDVKTGTCLKNFEKSTGIILSAKFSPHGKYIVTGGQNKLIQFWDRETGELNKTLSGHTSSVLDIKFSPDGHNLMSSGEDGTIRLWDIEKEICIKIFESQNTKVESIDFSPSGLHGLSGNGKGTIKIWDIHSGKCIRTINEHSSSTGGVKFSPCGRYIASGSSDKTVKCFSMPLKGERIYNGSYKKEYLIVKPRTVEESFKDEEIFKKLLAEGEGYLKERKWEEGHNAFRKSLAIPGYAKDIRALSGLNKAGSGGVREGLKSVWLLKVIEEEAGAITADIYKDNSIIWSGKDSTLHFTDFNGDIKKNISIGKDEILKVRSLTHERAVTAGSDKSIKICSLEQENSIKIFQENIDIKSMDTDSNGSYIITGGGMTDSAVKIWDIEKSECIRAFRGHTSAVEDVKISSDNRTVLSAGNDKSLKLWEVESGKCLRNFMGHIYPVTSCAISSSGETVASGSQDKTIRIWDNKKERCIYILKGHEGAVTSIDFTGDGKFLVSSSHDKTVRIWNVLNGECIKILQDHKGEVYEVKFSSDGRYIISGGTDGVKIFEIDWNWIFSRDMPLEEEKPVKTSLIEPVTPQIKREFIPETNQYMLNTQAEKKWKTIGIAVTLIAVIFFTYMAMSLFSPRRKAQNLLKKILSGQYIMWGEINNDIKDLLKMGPLAVDVVVEDGLKDPPAIEINPFIIDELKEKIDENKLKKLEPLKDKTFKKSDMERELRNAGFDQKESQIIMACASAYTGYAKSQAIDILRQYEDQAYVKKKAVKELINLLSDKDSYVRLSAAQLLADLGAKEAIGKIKETMDMEKNRWKEENKEFLFSFGEQQDYQSYYEDYEPWTVQEYKSALEKLQGSK